MSQRPDWRTFFDGSMRRLDLIVRGSYHVLLERDTGIVCR